MVGRGGRSGGGSRLPLGQQRRHHIFVGGRGWLRVGGLGRLPQGGGCCDGRQGCGNCASALRSGQLVFKEQLPFALQLQQRDKPKLKFIPVSSFGRSLSSGTVIRGCNEQCMLNDCRLPARAGRKPRGQVSSLSDY